ncbi:MAG: O-antigen ligase family protein [Halioglobus sp.]|nr:O-antigen ligase family protein [Halioglobus sp.]
MATLPRPDLNRRWSLPNVVFLTYTLFLAGFYFVPNAVDLYKFYVIMVFLPGLFLLPVPLKLCWRSPLWCSLIAYLCYMLLSSFWSHQFSLAIFWRDVLYAVYILSFILLTLYFFDRNEQLPNTVMYSIALVVMVAAIFSIISFEPLTQLPRLTDARLSGTGALGTVNESAFVYGIFGVIALDYVRRNWGQGLAYLYAAGFAIIVLFVILTQSNTGLLALSVACALLFLFHAKRNSRALYIGLPLGLAAFLYLAWSLGLLTGTMDMGFTMRWPIWDHAIELWQSAPVFGLGYQKALAVAEIKRGVNINYAHSLFLSTLRDGGLVGFFLLLPVYVLALRAGLKMALKKSDPLYLCLFIFGFIVVLVSMDQILTRPRELWLVLWLPLACLIAHELGLIKVQSPDAPPG